jgi:pyruvate dehydrogenase E2 component (dihydrolipoamide acetyltransferase)
VGVEREIQVPDIGDFTDVDVIEVLVAPGDRVAVEDSLVTLESDKATLEVPSPVAGIVKELLVRVGDKVSEGRPLARIEVESEAEARPAPRSAAPAREARPAPAAAAPAREARPAPAAAPSPRELPRSFALRPEDLEEAAPRVPSPTPALRCGASPASSAST